jgi:SAM-dependent methyltransferase
MKIRGPILGSIIRFIEHPLTAGMNVDDARTTLLRRQIIREKGFLQKLYSEWYDCIIAEIPPGSGEVVELGSGAGFLKRILPEVVTTELLDVEGIDVRLPDNGILPFDDGAVRAIVMTDVLHHIRDSRFFFEEATRVVCSGGVIVMVEPWVTTWSRFVYTRLHKEPFLPESEHWEFPATGPLSGANGALPWIIFERDRTVFEREFSAWSIELIRPVMPFAYLFSGGVSMRSLCPGWLYGFVRFCETLMLRLGCRAAMFAVIKLVRI